MREFENNRKILVIDDEESNLLSVEAALKSENFEFFLTSNPLEGVAIFEVERPAVVIIDLRMPVMDGLELLRKIREVPDALFSVIILTGHGNKEDMNICYDLGANAFLRKPFNVIELRGLVRNLMLLENYKRELNMHRANLEGLVLSRTEDLRTEMAERLIAQKKLEKSEKKYRYLFQINTYGVTIADLKGKILEMNEACMELLGVTQSDLDTLDIHEIYEHPEYRETLIEQLRETEVLKDVELEIVNKKGRKLWISLSLKLIDYDGEDVLMSTLFDITEMHQTRQKLRETKK